MKSIIRNKGRLSFLKKPVEQLERSNKHIPNFRRWPCRHIGWELVQKAGRHMATTDSSRIHSVPET